MILRLQNSYLILNIDSAMVRFWLGNPWPVSYLGAYAYSGAEVNPPQEGRLWSDGRSTGGHLAAGVAKPMPRRLLQRSGERSGHRVSTERQAYIGLSRPEQAQEV